MWWRFDHYQAYGNLYAMTGQEYDFTPKEGLENKSQMVETVPESLRCRLDLLESASGKVVMSSKLSRHKETLKDSTA
uniref:Uncharacterized protein n=1 Tax=Tanacetum cinerariifolium TaxID=118510 RepID=A0A6L2NCP7_TANCI|nr:hypothetical protein [Tanacetum cinerariifolium]